MGVTAKVAPFSKSWPCAFRQMAHGFLPVLTNRGPETDNIPGALSEEPQSLFTARSPSCIFTSFQLDNF